MRAELLYSAVLWIHEWFITSGKISKKKTNKQCELFTVFLVCPLCSDVLALSSAGVDGVQDSPSAASPVEIFEPLRWWFHQVSSAWRASVGFCWLSSTHESQTSQVFFIFKKKKSKSLQHPQFTSCLFLSSVFCAFTSLSYMATCFCHDSWYGFIPVSFISIKAVHVSTALSGGDVRLCGLGRTDSFSAWQKAFITCGAEWPLMFSFLFSIWLCLWVNHKWGKHTAAALA